MEKDLPKNWIEIKLDKVVTSKKGKKPKILMDTEFENSVPYLDIRAFERNEIRRYADIPSSRIINENQIGIVWDGARSGWVTKGKYGAVGSTIAILNPIGVNENYLLKFLESKFDFLNTNTRGTGIPHVDPKILWDIDIPLPPLPEQKRIVAKLNKLFVQVEVIKTSLDKIPVLLKNLRQQVLTQAVTGQLTEEWRKGKKFDNSFEVHLQNAKDLLIEKKVVRKVSIKLSDINDNLGHLPQGWKRVSLCDIANIIDPNPSHRMPEYFPEGIPFLSTQNITKNGINFKKGKKVGESILLDQIKRYRINDGDFIFTRIGTIGKSTYIPVERKYAFSHAVCIISSYHPVYCIPQYLRFVLSSSKILDQSKEGIQSVGVPDLGMGKIRAFQIPLMDPEEQKEIISRANLLFLKIELIEEHYLLLKEKIENLPQTILHKAFKGDLGPQLESDGDARDLLKEIEKFRKAVGTNTPKNMKLVK